MNQIKDNPPPLVTDYVGDEHWGKGGRYIVDPATGKRVPAPAEEQPPPTNPGSGETAAESATHQPTVKGKRNG